jgi:hypothetical protein
MQTHLNPDRFQDTKVLLCTSLVNLRQQTPPKHVGNTTTTETSHAIALVLGSVTAFGGNAAWYAWDSTSGAADNNSTVIKPDSPQVGGNPGRWRMVGGTL